MSIPKAAGIETEYGIVVRGAPHPRPFLAARLMVRAYQRLGERAALCRPRYRLGPEGVATDTDWQAPSLDPSRLDADERDDEGEDLMLANGARYYVDHGHPEYSTPECLSARTLIAADKAGERVMQRCASWANGGAVLPPGERIFIYKNNGDHKGHTYGCHENYLLDARLFEGLLYRKTHWVFRYLLPFLVTRAVLCGAGKVGTESGPAVGYQLSQRADFFEMLMGPQTTDQRPLFNTRDEPHADPTRYRRLHVILGDANMSELSTFLKIGTTQLVLRMLEDEYVDTDLTLADPVGAMQALSRDLSFRVPLRLEGGREMTAIEIQRLYLGQSREYLRRVGASDEEGEVVEEWADSLDALETDWRRLATRLDWAIKRRLLESYLASHETTWDELAVWQAVVDATLDATPDEVAADTVVEKLRRRDAERASFVERTVRENDLPWASYPRQRELYFRLRDMDLEYHGIRFQEGEPDVGLFYRLQNRGAVERLLEDEEIARLVVAPPDETRARVRGQYVARHAPDIDGADWTYVRLRPGAVGNGGESLLDLTDPLAV